MSVLKYCLIRHKFHLIFGGTEGVPSKRVDFPQEFHLKSGASYVVTITRNGTYNTTHPLADFDNPESYHVILHTITKESSMHMAWLLPQYMTITAGEIMFSITGLEFSYSQVTITKIGNLKLQKIMRSVRS
jgi:hypothetical protein